VVAGAVVLAGALAAAPAAFAADAEVRAVDNPDLINHTWSPQDVAVQVGDTVTWRFDGTSFSHNVRVDGTPVDTPFAVAGPAVSWQFAAAGVYPFVCELHPQTMFGKVTVGNPPPPPPPPPSQQPWPNDEQPPESVEVVDETRPRLRGVRVKAVRNGARVRFRLSERARVSVRLKRAGVTVAAARRSFGRGAHRLTVRNPRLSGRYRVEIVARDLAGNRSAVKRTWRAGR
jgi:plastocyanin